MEEHRLTDAPHEGYSLCLWVRERLPDLQEGYLDALTAEAIRAHLAVCYFCAQEYRELEATVRLVETLPFVEPERDLTPAIMAAVRAQSGYSFQSPVVEAEASPVMDASLPRTITGLPRRGNSVREVCEGVTSPQKARDGAEVLTRSERFSLAAVLCVAAAAIISSSYGVQALAAAGGTLLGALGALRDIPAVGSLTNYSLAFLQHSLGSASSFAELVRSVPVGWAVVESGAAAAAIGLWAARRPAGVFHAQ
ncbi:MAG: hypothetical protein ACP5VE_12485 [Chthonomonadales bacterium]